MKKSLIKRVSASNIFMCRISRGADLLKELEDISESYKIRLGRIEAIGAVSRAKVGFFNQAEKSYEYIEFNKPLEIASLIGNISIKDGKPMVHAHVTFSDSSGKSFGGHLAHGTEVYACEAVIFSFDGNDLIREFDDDSALFLWTEL